MPSIYPQSQRIQTLNNFLNIAQLQSFKSDFACRNEDINFIYQMALSHLINQTIGMGKFQVQCFLILCLVDFNDGVELVLSSFLNPIIKVIFPQVSQSYLSLLASGFYIGTFFGSLSSGQLADIYGRRRVIIWGSLMQIIVSYLFYLANNLSMMLLLRFLYGFAYGFTVAITTSMYAEISPQKFRGKGILLLNFIISVGKIYAVALGYIFIEADLSQTNWKLMIVCGSFPNYIVLVGSIFVLHQSPRYLLANKQFEAGYAVLQIMYERNHNKKLVISAEQKQQIQSQFSQSQTEDHKSIKILFSDKYIKITLALTLCWIIINFCYTGQLVIEAFHLKDNSTSTLKLQKYFYTVLGQIPSFLISVYLVDHPLFGRKRSITIFFLGAAIFNFGFGLTTLVFIGSIARFFMKDVFQIIYPLTTESFKTKFRTTGFGFCSGSGRIGSIIMPFILIPLDNWSRGSVYFLFTLLCLTASIICWKLVEQTMKKDVDENPDKQILLLGSKVDINPLRLQQK